MPTIEEYKVELQDDVKVEPMQLDIECVRQGETFFKWAERAVHAKIETERVKFEFESVEARLLIRCREHPEEFGLLKITEPAIKASVHASSRLAVKADEYFKALRISSFLDKAV